LSKKLLAVYDSRSLMMNTNRSPALLVVGFLGDETPTYLERASEALLRYSGHIDEVYLVVNDCDEESLLFLKALLIAHERLGIRNKWRAVKVATYLVQLAKYAGLLKELRIHEPSEGGFDEYQALFEKTTHYARLLLQHVDRERDVINALEELVNQKQLVATHSELNILALLLGPALPLEVIPASKSLSTCTTNYLELVLAALKTLEAVKNKKIDVLAPREISKYIKESIPAHQVLEY